MVGIVSYGAYIPMFRMSREVIAQAWGGRVAAGERSVANHDEDSTTMAVAAGIDCLTGIDRTQVDGLYVATTTPVYREKQTSSIVALALDLDREVLTADFGDSLRASTIALRSAMEMVKSGSARRVLVTVADSRLGAPQGEFEQSTGDGAAALLIGDSDVAVEIEGQYTFTDEFTDLWRSDSDVFVRSWEDRFILKHGYGDNIRGAVRGVLKKYNLTPKDFAKVVLYAPDPRNQLAAVRELGFDVKTQLDDNLFSTVGNTGAAYALMMLVGTLETAKPGDRILLANCGDGGDAYILRVTEEIEKVRN
ncbi:3-hydroxy-3-methylglutaryl CoA synthase, partial [Chloroflexota bacterium]